jgi:iron complex outermembrane receptor protein
MQRPKALTHTTRTQAVKAIVVFLICFHAAILANLQAQQASPSPSPTPAGTTSEMLNQVIVTAGLPIEETVLPTVSPTDAVLGTDTNVLDTPRSVSILTKAQLEARQIEDINSLGQYASGTYSPSIFGAQAVPYIRGVTSELYQNGQRLQYYSDSMPPSFNQVESLQIVKGPGSPVIGDSNLGVGGYVNFTTKEPYFDQWHSTLTATFGDYVPGGASYLLPEWQIDTGGPLIKDILAIRVSYLGREGDTYYNNVKNQTQDIFAAVTWLPIPALSFNYTAQWYEARFNEDLGFNRVTQQLIDSNTYIAGPITPFFFGGTTAVPWAGYVPANANGGFEEVKLSNNDTLVSPGDSAYGKRFLTQLVSKAQISTDFQIVWRTLFEDTSSRKYSEYGYDEYNPVNTVVDTRLEFHWDFRLFGGSSTVSDGLAKDGKTPLSTTVEHPGILNQFVFGASYRHEANEDYSDSSNEPFAAYDLAQGPSFTTFPRAVVFGGRLIPGMPTYSASIAPTTLQSNLNDFGLFWQDNITITSWLSGYLGFREDWINAESRIPTLGTFVNGTGGTLQAGPYRARGVANPSYFGSVMVKPASWLTAYFTYNRTNAVQGQSDTGGIPANFNHTQLSNATELYEVGLKASMLHNTLYASFDTYYTTYTQYDQLNSPEGITSKGIELEATYQPNKNFNTSANLTWATYYYTNRTSIYTQTANYLDTFAPAFVDSNGGRGQGGTLPLGFSPNYAGVTVTSLDPDVTGLPTLMFNAYATYQLDCGLGISIGPQVTGQMYENPQKTLKIPAQVTWNGAIFYRQKNWEVQLNFFNFTDARNWTPVVNFLANDAIYPNEPFHMNITVKLKF